METDEIAALAQSITDQQWALDEISHGTEVMDDLITVEGKRCSAGGLQCVFFSLSSHQCPKLPQGELLCSPRTPGEKGMWFVHPQEYLTWKLTR